jgi:hypothetical protein
VSVAIQPLLAPAASSAIDEDKQSIPENLEAKAMPRF